MPKLAIYPLTRGLLSTRKRGFKAKSAKKILFFLFGNFRPLPNKNVQIWDHFFPLLFPKDSKSLKILDIRLREVGANRRLNSTSKVNRQTDRRTEKTDRKTDRQMDRQTDKQKDKSTYRKHWPRGPMLWKFRIGLPIVHGRIRIGLPRMLGRICIGLPKVHGWFRIG